MTNQENNANQSYNLKKDSIEWIKAIVIATLIVVLVRWFLFTPTLVSGDSMQPNFHDKERLIVNKIVYSFREPKRGEVIVFHAPQKKDYIKRVIALPGESVMVKGDDVFIDGKILDEPYIREQVNEARSKGTFYNRIMNYLVGSEGIEAVKVPVGTLFVMGDNRSQSKDSRDPTVGFIPYEEIVGRADIIFWPLSEFKIVQHPDGVIKE